MKCASGNALVEDLRRYEWAGKKGLVFFSQNAFLVLFILNIFRVNPIKSI